MKKIALLTLLLIPALGFSQSFYNLQRKRNLTYYGGTGLSTYFGDLQNPNPWQIPDLPRYNLVVGVEYFFAQNFSVRGEANWFRLRGDDAIANDGKDERMARNLDFFSNNKELSLTGTINLLPLPARFDRRAAINIYGFAGVGLLIMNPKTKMDGKTYELWKYQTEGKEYSRFQPAFPVGLGLRVKFMEVFSIVAEGGYRFLNTDHLDDVSGVIQANDPEKKGRYPNPADLKGGVAGDALMAAKLSDRRKEYDPTSTFPYTFGVRGNPGNKDSYFLFNVKLEYYLPTEFKPFKTDKLRTVRYRSGRRR